jgi:hypothetical protein
LIEQAMGKAVQRDVDQGQSIEGTEQFVPIEEELETLLDAEHTADA